MNIDRLFDVVGSALDAQRQRLNIISGNLANAGSTRSPTGGPYVRRDVVFQSVNHGSPFERVFSAEFGGTTEPNGVRVSKVISMTPKTTHPRHVPLFFEENRAFLQVVAPVSGSGPDGNTVNLEQQMTLMAENSLLYMTVSQFLAGRFNGWRNAINEGR